MWYAQTSPPPKSMRFKATRTSSYVYHNCNKTKLFGKILKPKNLTRQHILYKRRYTMSQTCLSCKQLKTLEEFELRSDTKKYRNQCKTCRNDYVRGYKHSVTTGERQKFVPVVKDNKKQCNVCNEDKDLSEFPKRRTAHGYRHECKSCKRSHLHQYYQDVYNEVRRKRFQESVHHRLARAQRNYIYKCLTKFKTKENSSLQYLHCSLPWLKQWLEFQFDASMNWENYGKTWSIDHVLPLSLFNLVDDKERYIAFDWKNLQPSSTNFQKSDKLLFNEYLHVTMQAHKFIQLNGKASSNGYQGLSESLRWLRNKLRYGKNPTDSMDNPQPKTKCVNGSETIWFWVF